MLSMGGSCAGSPEAKVLVAFFVLLFEGQRSFGMTFTVMVWAGRVLVMLDSLLFVKIHVARIDIWVRGDGLQSQLMGRRWSDGNCSSMAVTWRFRQLGSIHHAF